MSRLNLGRIVLGILLGVVALIVTSFFDALPNDGAALRGTVRFDVPDRGPWCGPSNRPGTKNCSYVTFEQCLEAVSSAYRSCRPNAPAALIRDEGPYRVYR